MSRDGFCARQFQLSIVFIDYHRWAVGWKISPKMDTKFILAFLFWASTSGPGDYEADVELYLEPQLDAVAEFNLGFTAHASTKRVQLIVPSVPLNVGGKGALVLRQKVNVEEKEIFRMPILETQPVPTKDK
ncbi:hypothetical protein [Sneathiella litorea]|uniref:Uncharacterized protein n=1 Tax=Sneathiella litorea TaxID=2606216 RepID=A0A6L8W851_9PROT|nr:hypothetical protein [Sneathiella litorea]MZR30417.1 hypothetical protein [Sneathiella litorea]